MNNMFSSLLGNENLKSVIAKDIVEKRASHAYLIEGPKGCGKHTFAREMIKGLSCKCKSGDIPCGQCEICKKISNGFFSDIMYVNSGDKATISVENIRQMTSTVRYAPNEDVPYKFYIIEEAEKLTPASQNALLLTLEEPPEYVVFFLLTEDSEALLETVRSRVISLKMELFSPETVINYINSLAEYKTFSSEKIRKSSVISKGSIGMAMEILKGNSKNEALFSYADKLVSLITKGKSGELFLFISSQKPERQDCEPVFDFVLSAFRDLIAFKNGHSKFMYFDSEEAVSKICSKITLSKLHTIYNEAQKAKFDICYSNANINLVMNDFAAKAVGN